MKKQLNRRYLVITVIALFTVVLLTILSIINPSSNNMYSDNNDNDILNQIADNTTSTIKYSSPLLSIKEITGLDDSLTRTLPNNELDNINLQLDSTLRMNGVVNPVSDANMRNGSYHQTIIDNNKMIYYTTFIIDIPSLQQSYVIQNEYSPLPIDQTGLYDYTTLVLCPDASQSIYATPTCIDRIKQEQGNV